MSAVPHGNHHTVGVASWQNHGSSSPQSVIILHSNVCLGLSNPYISSALWRQSKSKNTAHYIPILLRGFGEAMVTNDWCIIYSLWCTSHEHLVLSHHENIMTPNTNMTSADILFNLFPTTSPFSRGSVPAFLRKRIATCDFPGESRPHVAPLDPRTACVYIHSILK